MKQKLRRYFYYYRKEIGIIGACCFVALIGLLCILPKSKASSGISEDTELTVIDTAPETIENIPTSTIRVDIKGAVTTPGVYEMNETDRVIDVIHQAGGTLENADLSRINLSKHVTDEMVILIYTKDQIDAYNESQTKIEYVYVEPECTCPDTINNACIEEKPIENEQNIPSDKISINTATQEQLESLPGIGASKAQAIIEYRMQKPFQTIEELKEIKGIGEALFEKIQDYITI